jgi:hypothetical protein
MLYETQHLKQRENFSGTFARDKTFKMETTVGLAGRGRGKALCMKSLQVARRFFTRTTFVLVASAVVWKGASLNAYAQYSNTSEDLKDIVAEHPTKGHLEPGMHQPSPIGNLGNLDVVVDLRGFVPMSFWSATAAKATFAGHSDNFKGDVLRWYKIPTKKALLMLYFGDLTSTHIADDTTKLESRFAKTRFLKESDASGETASWCKLAYEVAKDSEPIFQRIAGDGFLAAEPTTVFFTDQSVFVVLSFKYTALLRNNTGQVLTALEFSRSSRQYRTFYEVYSTAIVSKTTGNEFKETAPTIAKALAAVF